MKPCVSKRIVGAGVAAVLVLYTSWMGHDVVAQTDGVTGVGTVEQCIDNGTGASVDPREEETLVKEGLIEEKLDEMKVTEGMCEEIIARTPGGTPVERAVAAGNVIQELDIIEESMKDVGSGDVNGDGVVNADDSRTASTSSYAAAHAAQKAVRTAIDGKIGGVIEEINAEPAAYLPNAAQAQYGDDGNGGQDGERLPSYEELQTEAQTAAVRAGASPKAAAAGGDCAAEVARFDGTLPEYIRGHIALNEPPEDMLWKDSETITLRVSPALIATMKDLKQQLEEAEEADEIKVECISLTNQMKANLIGSAFDIEARRDTMQSISTNAPTEWEWEFVASNEGSHDLYLNLSADLASGQEGGLRSVIPAPLDDDINVRATPWQKAANFVKSNWQWLWTAILVPVALFLWGRFKRSSERGTEG